MSVAVRRVAVEQMHDGNVTNPSLAEEMCNPQDLMDGAAGPICEQVIPTNDQDHAINMAVAA